MKTTLKILKGITEVFNVISILALLFMMCLVCANVVLRYLLNSPITGSYELTRMSMICLSPCMAVTILAKKNVWVDVLTSHFNRTAQFILDITTLPLSVAICGLMAWRAYEQIYKSIENKTHFTTIDLYEWPFRIVFFIALSAATLAAIAYTIERISQYRNGGIPHDESDVEHAIKMAQEIPEDKGDEKK